MQSVSDFYAEARPHLNYTSARENAELVQAELDRLESKGFVEREYLDGNRRNIMVRRSPAGIEVQARCDAIVHQAEQAYLSPIPPEDVDRLVRQLTQLFHSRENQERRARQTISSVTAIMASLPLAARSARARTNGNSRAIQNRASASLRAFSGSPRNRVSPDRIAAAISAHDQAIAIVPNMVRMS